VITRQNWPTAGLDLREDGRPLSSVAAELSMSEGTVRNHMSSAIRKLGTRNRATALRRALDAGWL
jgi:two-component system response regulator DesR